MPGAYKSTTCRALAKKGTPNPITLLSETPTHAKGSRCSQDCISSEIGPYCQEGGGGAVV